MTPATDGANAPPGNSRFEAIASSTLTGRFLGVPFFRPSVSPGFGGKDILQTISAQ